MAKVVIDANIIISSAFGGIPLEATVKAMGAHEVYLSLEIEAELRGVFSRLSKKLVGERQTFVGDKISELIGMATFVTVSKQIVLSRDAKDDHYLSLSKEVGAHFLITGDKDLLDIPHSALAKKGIQTRIVNPREFLEEVT
jgi:putative PIN family toxin of toxin-antitoxin system